MNMRRLRFDYIPIAIDILPADPKVNRIYAAAAMAHVQHLTLAAQLGRVSEDRAEQALAKAYAEGVVVGSPTPGYEHYERSDWERWLLAHRDEFAQLRSIAEVPENFESGKPEEYESVAGASGA